LNQFANNQLCRLSTRMRQLGELFNPTRAGISEVVIPPVSRFIKQTVGELRLRKLFGISLRAINRGDQVFRDDVRGVSLRAGDTLVLHSNWRDLELTAEDKDLVVVTDIPKETQRPGKIWQAVGFFLMAQCLALAAVGMAYFYFFGRRLLPGHEDERLKVTPGRTESYFAETYGIAGDTAELTVTAESPLVGMSIGEAEQLHDAPLILAIKSGNESRMAPPADHVIWVGSVLGVLGAREQLNQFANNQLCRLSTRMRQLGELFNPTRAGISEVVIPPVSRFIKQTVGELRLRKRFGISVLAINRGDQVFRDDVRGVSLRAGDTLVLHSNWRDLELTAEDKDLVVVTDIPKETQRPGKIWQAVGFFLMAQCLALFTDLDLSVSMMTGAVAMLLTGVLNMDEAYRAVNWKTIFVIACLIPLGWSMDATGTAAWLAQEVLKHLGGAAPWVLQASLAILALLFSQVMSNVGATVMMVPIAISVAIATGGNPSAYALIVAVSSSNTFLLSSGHPALMMITGPGGYRGKDFLRVGAPLTLLILATTLVVINLMFR
jgi:di/tricarboxylate transporter